MAKHPHSASVDQPAPGQTLLHGHVAACTDIGRHRSHNEDNLLIFDLQRRSGQPAGKTIRAPFNHPGSLLAVADGMGGHSSGQVASQLCVERLPKELLKALPGENASEADWTTALTRAVEATNEFIYHTAQENSDYEGMGCTLTAALLNGSQAWIAQVGDSRAYLLRQGRYTQLTRDQTVANTLQGPERDALRQTPFEGMLLQAMGPMESLNVVVTTTDLTPGDILLICCDGLYRVVPPEQMQEVLERSLPLQEKADTFIALANEGGGPDNITTVLCQVREGNGK